MKFDISFAFCCPGLGMVLCMHILTLWFLPSFAHYFMKVSAAWTAKESILTVLRKCNFQCSIFWWISIFLSDSILLPTGFGSVQWHPTLWFLPSFAHYFMKPSAALDSIRINLNSVWRKFNFQCTYFVKFDISFACNFVACACTPNFMAHYFKAAGQQSYRFWQCEKM